MPGNAGSRITAEPPYAPSLQGLNFRRFEDEGDHEGIAGVMNRSWEADRVDATVAATDIGRTYAP